MFKKVWAVVSGEEEVPEATLTEYSTKKVLVAAAVHGDGSDLRNVTPA